MHITVEITPTLTLDERCIEERFVRASGPGGQNVNKVATAVELRVDLRVADLPAAVRQRLIALAGRKITAEGVLLIDSREHRTQAMNREAARARLAALVRRATVAPKHRRPTKVTRGAVERRLDSKKKRGSVKAGRSRTSESD